MILGMQKIAFAQFERIKSYLADDSKLPESAKPWVFWYWMHSAFSREGITADLEAMKEAGIAGAYIAPIKGKTNPPLFEPVTETLTSEWWDIFKYTIQESERLGIKIALLPNDGFATAGGPWITPEMSMQKVVWTETFVKGGKTVQQKIEQPESYQGFYKDIAVYAFPTVEKSNLSTDNVKPKVTTSTGEDASFLAESGNKKNFGSANPCWIQYEFAEPFLCRSIKITVNNFNYQSNRLIIETSNDGKNFTKLTRLIPPRTGWLDWDAPVTHAIEPTTAKYFRFVYDPEASEPGAEDLDAAKWKQSLKIAGISLSGASKINHLEGKNGQVWRVSDRTTSTQIADKLCIPLNKVIDISAYLNKDGELKWKAPSGSWTILRIGHTSTGHKNETAGAGKGLESDKFNKEVAKIQFDKWFGEAKRVAGPELAAKVFSIFHIDSWECGSQNWSPVFEQEFLKRRGYSIKPYLPIMAGIPLESAEKSEQFLYDVRTTIAELINDNFFKTMKSLAKENGVVFTSETTAPVMVGDGLTHFGTVDVPMGEFWHSSPSHDKFGDMSDAISGAHIYGKNIVQAEAFTTIRMQWDEHPGNLKTLQDRNYALGTNKLVYHVYVHNPWMDRKPGMTLDGIGLYFQRDQTWWKPGKAWIDYASRSQALLQEGHPVRDIAVFIGEEVPRRSILPDRFVNTLPGIFGEEVVQREKTRLENKGLPTQKVAGVTTSANMAQPEDWVNPLKGYAYDSFNPEVLYNAKVINGRVKFRNGADYGVLVFPGKQQLNPNNKLMTLQTAKKMLDLVKEGATVLIMDKPVALPNQSDEKSKKEMLAIVDEIFEGDFIKANASNGKTIFYKTLGNGKIIKGPYEGNDFNLFSVDKDLIVIENGKHAEKVAWNHRKSEDLDIYFIANQEERKRNIQFSFRLADKKPYIYQAVTGKLERLDKYSLKGNRTELELSLEPNQAVFVLFHQQDNLVTDKYNPSAGKDLLVLNNEWQIQFDESFGGPKEPVKTTNLFDWSKSTNDAIKYYSGTTKYTRNFKVSKSQIKSGQIFIDLGELSNIATVKLNGLNCGVVWTYPYQADISKAIKVGNNLLEIEVSNTWANRLIGDQKLPEGKRITKTTAPIRLQEGNLLKAGLMGPVKLIVK